MKFPIFPIGKMPVSFKKVHAGVISHKLPPLSVKESCQLIQYNGLVGAPAKILTGNFSSVSLYNKINEPVVFGAFGCRGSRLPVSGQNSGKTEKQSIFFTCPFRE